MKIYNFFKIFNILTVISAVFVLSCLQTYADTTIADEYNRPNETLGTQVSEMTERIQSDPKVTRLSRTNLGVKAFRTQVLNTLKHVSFQFRVRDNTYVHDYVLDGPYPQVPTELALERAAEFLEIIHREPEYNVEENKEYKKLEAQYLKQQKDFIRNLTKNSVESYLQMRSRLVKYGPNASFRTELGPIVEVLKLRLMNDPELKKAVEQDVYLKRYRALMLKRLDKLVNVKGIAYPYLKTVEAIQNTMEFYDIYQRATDPKRSPVLYHSARYGYYNHFLKGEVPEHILLPTLVSLGATDILKVRGVPVGLVGVNTDITWVDGFYQTSYEFWVHDINHSRRMFQFLKEAAHDKGMSIEEFAKFSDRFVREKIIPMIAIKKGDSFDEKNKKRLIKIIFFEVLHEDALPATPEIVRRAILRPPKLITPFENIKGNTVVYIMEPGATTLAYVYRKLAHDFYDMPGERIDYIVHPDFRTRKKIVEGSKFIFEKLGFVVRPEVLEYYANTDEGFPSNFLQSVKKDIEKRPDEAEPLRHEVKISKKQIAQVVANDFHTDWQKRSGYLERWKPAQAVFNDGRGINDDFTLKTKQALDEYLREKGVPINFHRYFILRKNPKTEKLQLFEDIQHLPHKFLAANNQYENIQGAMHAVRIVDQIKEQSVHFSEVRSAIEWLREKAQSLNKGWLERNWHWAKDYPEYNKDWKDLAALKKKNGIYLLKIAIETITGVDPEFMHSTQKSLMDEAIRQVLVTIERQGAFEYRSAITGQLIHENWRKRSTYKERWKPGLVRLDDGSHVRSELELQNYFKEKNIPKKYQHLFKIKKENRKKVIFVDIKNLPFDYLPENHQKENIESGTLATEVIDRIWNNSIKFSTLSSVKRWFRSASQTVHQGVLDRNTNGARNNPIYNTQWTELPPLNQAYDLDLIRMAFEARVKHHPDQILEEQVMLIRRGISMLYQDIGQAETTNRCSKVF